MLGPLVKDRKTEGDRVFVLGSTYTVSQVGADVVVFAVTRPWHVNLDEIVLKPVAQARATVAARGVGL